MFRVESATYPCVAEGAAAAAPESGGRLPPHATLSTCLQREKRESGRRSSRIGDGRPSRPFVCAPHVPPLSSPPAAWRGGGQGGGTHPEFRCGWWGQAPDPGGCCGARGRRGSPPHP